LMQDPVYKSFLCLLQHLSSEIVDPEQLAAACRDLFFHLAEKSELYRGEIVGDPWHNHLLDRIVAADNVFSRKAGLNEYRNMGPALLQAVQYDLRVLQRLAALGETAYQEAKERLQQAGYQAELPQWPGFTPLAPSPSPGAAAEARQQLKRELAACRDWDRAGLELLAGFYAAHGAGFFGSFRAFRWVHSKDGGYLKGIANPDPVRLQDLVGYEQERAAVVQNTEKFLHGLPASNVLLYGARGTGKSSTVKGLVAAYGDRGLRLVELPKRYLSDYQEILQLVESRPQKFIIFLDDISFEEDEVEYKELKGLLEGSLQARPDNVLVYATSNRRHLVKEYFSDREQSKTWQSREVRQTDTLQEKLSLAERFGLTVIFYSPDQEEYLAIVRELAGRYGLNMDEQELRQQALRWALYQNGTSGRTARQFVDYLYGEINFKNISPAK
ncbi:MAG: ATP-binding protein, partial [Clostridia bacterium]|nr:ATP-binding protein [Clostridia bacterium]